MKNVVIRLRAARRQRAIGQLGKHARELRDLRDGGAHWTVVGAFAADCVRSVATRRRRLRVASTPK